MKKIDNFTHEWKFDLPWHMVDIKEWFYMVNVGYIKPIVFLHVRILGVRSIWTFPLLIKRATDFRRARGVIPWKPGDELPEDTIRRLRGG